MPLFDIFSGWYVKMRLNDHNPPHFHAVKGDTEVKVDFLSGELKIVRGKLSPADQRKLLIFAKENEHELNDFWNQIHNL